MCENIKSKDTCLKNDNCHYVGNNSCTTKSIYSVFINGGMGYGTLCMPNNIIDLAMIIIFPPAYVFFYQKKRDFKDIMQIIVSFILTMCFYFPGLLHAYYLKYKDTETCNSLFNKDNNIKDESN